MMRSAFTRGLLVGVGLLAGMPLSVAARCRQIGEPLFVIDGRQHTLAEIGARNLSRDSVEASFSYFCWNPADSTFHWSRGPRDLPAGFAVAMVHTCLLDVGRPSPSTVSERQRSCSFTIAEGEKHILSTDGDP